MDWGDRRGVADWETTTGPPCRKPVWCRVVRGRTERAIGHAKAILIRGVEQRLLSLFAEGKLFGTVHTCIGQEWTGIAVAEALIEGDVVFTNHRGHGHFLARTEDVGGLIAEVMGKQSGVCGGRGGSQHLCGGGVFSNGIQGGIVPVSAGIALAQQLRETGRIAVVFIGDGTLGEGAIYEALEYRLEMAASTPGRAREQPLRPEHAAVADTGRRNRGSRRCVRHRCRTGRHLGTGRALGGRREVRRGGATR